MNKNTKFTNPMKVITGPNTRWSYANVWEPKSINGGAPNTAAPSHQKKAPRFIAYSSTRFSAWQSQSLPGRAGCSGKSA